MVGILVLFHCESNPGYAASSHEMTFLEMARRLVGSYDAIHFAYPDTRAGRSPTLPDDFGNIVQFDAASKSKQDLGWIEQYVRDHSIQIVFGFDQPVKRLSYGYLRRGGVKHFVSYWGAPMGSKSRGLKLALKKLDVLLARYRPDHFIFQSEGMRQTGIHGRGIPARCTSVVKTGINIDSFGPPAGPDWYAHDKFGIDRSRKIIFFSGHMEERKGVHVTIKAAKYLRDILGRADFHLLILGNRNGQEKRFDTLYKKTAAEKHITFGGYRNDIPKILKSCSIGFIASTGWDSFPMSSIEMSAAGMPLVVSDLPGLREAVTPETGILYSVGDYKGAAKHITTLLDNEELRQTMGRKARQRAVQEFSVNRQIAEMETIVRRTSSTLLFQPQNPPSRQTGASRRLV